MQDPFKLTPERERLNLYKHGTLKWELTPNAILETAKRDLLNRQINAQIKVAREQHPKGSLARKQCGTLLKFVFLPRHVMKAVTPQAVLKAALDERRAGLLVEKVETVAVYDNQEVLLAALRLAEEAA